MHTRPLLRTLTAAGVVAALAAPGAAVAQTFTHRDAVHDVQRYDVSTRTFTNAWRNRSVDIVQVRLSYSRKSLTGTAWLRSGEVGPNWMMVGRIRTWSARFEWDATADRSGHTLALFEGNAQIACDGLSLHVKRHKGRLRVTVPASCLGSPRAVRAGMVFGIWTSDTVSYYDDALQKRGLDTDGKLALSRRLHRNR